MGTGKLPELGAAVGETIKDFKRAIHEPAARYDASSRQEIALAPGKTAFPRGTHSTS